MPKKKTMRAFRKRTEPFAPAESAPEASMGNAAAQEDLGISSEEAEAEASVDAATGAPKKTTTHQSTDDMDALYEQAATALVSLGAATASLAASTGGEPLIPDTLKKRDKAEKKVAKDYGGDASQLLDLARTSVFYEDAENLHKGIEAVDNNWDVVRRKDRFSKPVGGYRDMMYNVMIEGHICEIQLHLKTIIEAKEIGHDDYDRIDDLKKKGGLTEEEHAELDALQKKQWKLYNEAYAAGGGEVKDEHRAMEG